MRCLVGAMVVLGCSRAPDAVPTAPPAPATTMPSAVTTAQPPATVAVVASIAPLPAASSETPPAVDVRSIGMHIGGGPNDDANKGPLLASIAPHHPALGKCWAALPNKPKVDLGVDAHIPAKGGRARIDRPRSTVPDAAFVACAVAVFEQIEFVAPKSGMDTTVSTSVRLSPRVGAT